MKDTQSQIGSVKIYEQDGASWKLIHEDHNVSVLGHKQLLAQQAATGSSGMIFNKIAAGTTNTTFTSGSNALTTEVGNTTTLTNTYSGITAVADGVIFFGGNYTIQELGLYYDTTALAFANCNVAVTSLKPIRVNWSMVYS